MALPPFQASLTLRLSRAFEPTSAAAGIDKLTIPALQPRGSTAGVMLLKKEKRAEMKDLCPVCDSKLKDHIHRPGGKDADFFSCPLCGDFLLSGSLLPSLPEILQRDKDSSAKLSHTLRQSHEAGDTPMLLTSTVDKIMDRKLPKPREQANLLIRWLGNNVDGPGETIWLEPPIHKSIIGAKSDDGFALVLKYLFDVGLLTGNLAEGMREQGRAHATLSFEGWEYYEELKLGGFTYRKAFIAMKFDDPLLDKVVTDVFKPCVEQAGFVLYTLDDVPRAGLIDDRLRVEIQSSDFLIADLTHDNPGAYWEAGYAEGLGKPVIYTCEKNKFKTQKTHFDTNHHLTVLWDKENPEDAGEALKATIRATLPQLAKMED